MTTPAPTTTTEITETSAVDSSIDQQQLQQMLLERFNFMEIMTRILAAATASPGSSTPAGTENIASDASSSQSSLAASNEAGRLVVRLSQQMQFALDTLAVAADGTSDQPGGQKQQQQQLQYLEGTELTRKEQEQLIEKLSEQLAEKSKLVDQYRRMLHSALEPLMDSTENNAAD